jgi:peptide/nickel transport system permease protein
VITERVFAMPGVGSLMVDAVHAVDLPLLLGCTLFGAALIVVANFVVDVLYGVLDPRVRLN